MAAISVMRNRVTTEFRKVEPGGDEYLKLQAQRDPNDGYPVWEETGLHDAIEQSKRLESGNPLPTDIGDANQPVGRITGAHETYVPASAVRDPLPSEREAGSFDESRLSGSLPQFEGFDEEHPLTASMEGATDTEVSGKEPDMKEVREKQSEERQARAGRGGRRAAEAGTAQDSGTQASDQSAASQSQGRPASDAPPGEAKK